MRSDNGTNGLIKRLEEQAVKIAYLENENEMLRNRVDAARRNLLESMARAGVNCGSHYGCYLAGRMLADDKSETV